MIIFVRPSASEWDPISPDGRGNEAIILTSGVIHSLKFLVLLVLEDCDFDFDIQLVCYWLQISCVRKLAANVHLHGSVLLSAKLRAIVVVHFSTKAIFALGDLSINRCLG